MKIGLIWAEAHGGAIGADGGMPWHVPEDLAHFKAETLGSPVVMGRKTWESLPERSRPLPRRANVIVTRNKIFAAVGATTVSSLDTALVALTSATAGAADQSNAMIWVIGGGELFREVMPRATNLSVTKLDLDVPNADTFAPEIGPEWQLIDRSNPATSSKGIGYRFERYQRGSDTLDG